MTTPRKPGGYIHRQEINRAVRANKRARQLVAMILDEQPGNGKLYLLLAELAQAEGTVLEALIEMSRIIKEGDGEKS